MAGSPRDLDRIETLIFCATLEPSRNIINLCWSLKCAVSLRDAIPLVMSYPRPSQTLTYLSSDLYWPLNKTMIIWVPGQALTLIYFLLSKMHNLFRLQSSQINKRVGLDLYKCLLWLKYSDWSVSSLSHTAY